MNRNVLLAVLVAVTTLAPASVAVAAADLTDASPPPGSEVDEAPEEIVLRFTQDLIEANIELDGEAVDANVDGNVVQIEIQDLDDGEHHLAWRVSSEVDGVETSGEYTFEVVNEEDSGPPEVDPEAQAEEVAETGDESRTEVLLWTALGVAAAAVFGLVFFFFRSTLPTLPEDGLSGGLPPPGESPPEHHEEGNGNH
jgi:methionine-rich copper-binding protein CopC